MAAVALMLWTVLAAPGSVLRGQDRPAPPASPFVLASGRAGPFEVGMPIDAVYKLAGQDHVRITDLFSEGFFTPAVTVRLPNAARPVSLVAHVREWPCSEFAVWGIAVHDSRFRTQEGAGVGSTLGRLRRLYDVELGHGEGGVAAIVSKLQLTFFVTGRDDASRVTSVWVVPQPARVRQERCPQLGPLGSSRRDKGR